MAVSKDRFAVMQNHNDMVGIFAKRFTSLKAIATCLQNCNLSRWFAASVNDILYVVTHLRAAKPFECGTNSEFSFRFAQLYGNASTLAASVVAWLAHA